MFLRTVLCRNPALFGQAGVELTSVRTSVVGAPDSKDWRMYFSKEVKRAGDERISAWHDIPFSTANPQKENLLVFVNEIKKGTRAKMELNKNEPFNPVAQDLFKKKPGTPLRNFTYGDLPFNYGFVPRTWEDPNVVDKNTSCVGDADPIDVVELSVEPLPIGTVTEVRVLGLLGLVDEGETDWKLITCRTSEKASVNYRRLTDVPTSTLDTVYKWFRYYKTTDGKKENEFAFDGKFRGVDDAMTVSLECEEHYKSLMSGKVPNPGYWLRP